MKNRIFAPLYQFNLTNTMKKYLLSSAWFLCFLLILSSCEKEEDELVDGDLSPYSLYLDVVDSEGNSLIASGSVAGVPFEKITVSYNGQTDTLKNTLPFLEGELYCTEKDGKKVAKNLLVYGWFSPYEMCENQNVVFDWGDGTKDTVTFSYYPLKNKKGFVYDAKCSILLNGKQVTNPLSYPVEYVRIVKRK